jgi:hypothetical protein
MGPTRCGQITSGKRIMAMTRQSSSSGIAAVARLKQIGPV